MFLSCKCLNIILKYSGRQLLSPTQELLSFPNHEFFRDNSLITSTADDNFAVLKRQPALIDEQVIDIWNITRCINCYQYTYAVSDNPDNSSSEEVVEPQIIKPVIKYLVLNKSLISADNFSDDSNSELSRTKVENLPDDNFKGSTPRKDNNSKLTMSDNFRLVASDNLKKKKNNNSISDNIPLIHSTSTKTTLMTDNSSFINYNSPIVVDNSSLTTSDNKTIIFSDNVPLINVDNSGVISGVDNTCLTNSIISIDNSITSRSTTNLINDNSGVVIIINDNNSTFTSSDNNSTLIGGDNLKISATTGDNSTISDDDINSTVNKNNVFVKMRNHPDYSDIYNVIVDSDNDGDDIDDNEILMMRKQLLPGVQESLGNLHQQYETKVKNIKDVVEENIKQFTAKQYEYLENYKDKGHHHYYVLTNKILRNEFKKMKRENIQVIADIQSSDDIEKEEKDKTELVSKPKITGDSVRPITQDNNFIVPGSLIYSDNNNKMTTDGKRVDINREKEGGEKRAKRKQMKNYNGDIDDEVIFAIEGMDDNDNDDDDDMEVEDNNKASDDNEDDDDDDNDDGETDDSGQDEGIHIPRVQRGGHPTLAKSLPVTVPNFGFSRRKQRDNDGQQSVDPQDPHNIRASIKALAKSVHGDTVFGDLPRPRFSTEI
ncbi:Protein of unknown function [Cotesia congregata]|uniref:Uncharacterized protein n=1 Tax=Cotesia congregata TaxID=51543 RepID=A0A8J2EMT3_COTCN|nr:Protein of unknown function [Cotesia congregata]